MASRMLTCVPTVIAGGGKRSRGAIFLRLDDPKDLIIEFLKHRFFFPGHCSTVRGHQQDVLYARLVHPPPKLPKLKLCQSK